MRTGKAAAALLLSGTLVGGVSACGSGDPKEGPAVIAAESKIEAPPAFDSTDGWEYQPTWVPGMQPLPVAASKKGDGAVAYLDQTIEGYVLRVREAASGDELWSSEPWQAPDLTKSQQESALDGDDWMTVPQVTLVSGGAKDYFAVFAYGEKRKDELHKAEEGVSVAFFPVEASGDSVAPVSTADVQDVSGSSTRVRATTAGLVIRDGTEVRVVDAASGAISEIPELSSDGDWVEPAVPLPTGTVLNRYSGGFGMVGGWQSEQVAPPGIKPVVAEEGLFSEISKTNGEIKDFVGNHVIAAWKDSGDENNEIVAVHDAATGRVEATVDCSVDVSSGTNFEVPENETDDARIVLSPNGQYLAADGALFDLKSGKATCADEGDNAKDIELVSVGDDGVAYGWAEGDSDDDPLTPVAVTVQGSKPLPVGTRIPDAVVGGVGVFPLDSGQDTTRLVVVAQKG